jgi:hypothetical protein
MTTGRTTVRSRNPHHHTLTRVRRIWNELDYSQRRLFELRTGIPVTGPAGRRRDDHEIVMLEDLYRRGWRR